MAAQKVCFGNVSVDILLENLTFDFAAGRIYWKAKGYKRTVGAEAGWVSKGYRQVSLNYRTMLTHRAIWAAYYGSWPDGMLDHKDGNPLNNRIDNLRIATPVENSINKKSQRNNTSGFKGVTFHPQSGKWRARISKARQLIQLGLHDTPELAAAAYLHAATSIHGDFARNL